MSWVTAFITLYLLLFNFRRKNGIEIEMPKFLPNVHLPRWSSGLFRGLLYGLSFYFECLSDSKQNVQRKKYTMIADDQLPKKLKLGKLWTKKTVSASLQGMMQFLSY